MNCPNGHGPMAKLKKFFVCEECEFRQAHANLTQQPRADLPLDLNGVPFPIAYPLAHAMDPALCPSASDRLDNLIFAAQQTIRLSALLLLADYLSCETKCRELDGPIRSLRMPHWGEWSVLADKLTKFWNGDYPGAKPERLSRFEWLLTAWNLFSKGNGSRGPWADVLAKLPGLQGPARSLNDALWKARNDAAHRRTTRSGLSSQADQTILDQLLPLFSQVVVMLFPHGALSLQRRVSLNPLQVVHLEGAHLDLRFKVESPADGWRDVIEASDVVAVAAKEHFPVPLHPLVVPLDSETESEIFGGDVAFEPAALLDQVAGKQVVILGVKTFRDRADLLEPFRQAIQRKQVDFGVGRSDTKLWNLAEWSAESARFTLDELRGRKYFPECYVERSGVDNVVDSCLAQSGRALLLLGEAGCGKSSLLSRFVDRLTSDAPQAEAKNKKDHDGELSLKQYMESRGGGDVVIFLSGRAAFGGDASLSGRALLCETVLQKAGIRSGSFRDLGDLIACLGETVNQDLQSGRKVWLIFDALNEADRFMDLLAALDEFLPAVSVHPWLRLVVSIRSGAYEALDRRHTLHAQTGPGVFANEHHFFSFFDERSNKQVPYLTLRPFTKEEGAAAYRLRVEKLPDRSAKFAWESLSSAIQELLFSPLHLHLFHETYLNQSAKPEELGEDALFSAYLEHLSSEMPGLRATIGAIGLYMYEHRTPVLPVEVADQWITDWRKGIHSSTAAAKLDPIEELVSASLLMRPTEEGLGVDRKLVAFQFSHQKMCEQILWAELHRQVAPRPLPESGTFFAWAQYAAGIEKDDTSFTELTSALERVAVEFVVAGDGEPIAMLLDLEHEQTRERLMEAGLRALGQIWGPTKEGAPKAAAVIGVIGQYAASKHSRVERFALASSRAANYLSLRSCSQVACGIYVAVADVLRRIAAIEPSRTDLNELLALSLNNLGALARSEGSSAVARAMFEEAVAIRKTLVAAEPSRTDFKNTLSVSLSNLGALARSEGSSAVASAFFGEALEIDRALVADEPNQSDFKASLSASLQNLGGLAVAEGSVAVARALYEEALAIDRALVAAEPSRTDFKVSLSVSLVKLGALAKSEGSSAVAHALYEEALVIRRTFVAAEPSRSDLKKLLSGSLDHLGGLATAEGSIAVARALYEEALAIDRALVAAEPSRTDLKECLAISLVKLGALAKSEASVAVALAMYEESLVIQRTLVAADPNRSDLKNELSASLNLLGRLAESDGSSAVARARYEEALAIDRALMAAEPSRTDLKECLSSSLRNLAGLLLDGGDWAVANKLWEERLAIDRSLLAAEPSRTDLKESVCLCLISLGALAMAERDSAAARVIFEEALTIRRALVAAEPNRADFIPDLIAMRAMLNTLGLAE